MLNLQREVERIIKHTGDYDCFITDEQFSRTYRFKDDTLVLTKTKDLIKVIFSDFHFEFKSLTHNPRWYPIQVVKGNEVISILINYENGRAYSARNWYRFSDLAQELGRLITGMEVEVLNQDHEQMNDETLFKQISLW